MCISEDQNISGQDTSKSGYQDEHKAGFENLWVWQRAHKLMLEIHKICKNLPSHEKFRRRDQLERSSSAVPDNIAEGHTTYYYNDKIKGFMTAGKEAGETQNHFRSLEGKNYITKWIANNLIYRYEEVIRGINGYTRWVRKKKGAKK